MIDKVIEIYTDGSSLGNPGPGGFGVVFVDSGKITKELGGFDEHTTNNKMELQGVIEALRYATGKDDLSQAKIILHSDSSYVLGGVTSWINSWERNGWRTANKKPVLNRELWMELVELSRNFKGDLKWEKVKGHSGHVYNDRADEIATSFANGQGCNLI